MCMAATFTAPYSRAAMAAQTHESMPPLRSTTARMLPFWVIPGTWVQMLGGSILLLFTTEARGARSILYLLPRATLRRDRGCYAGLRRGMPRLYVEVLYSAGIIVSKGLPRRPPRRAHSGRVKATP